MGRVVHKTRERLKSFTNKQWDLFVLFTFTLGNGTTWEGLSTISSITQSQNKSHSYMTPFINGLVGRHLTGCSHIYMIVQLHLTPVVDFVRLPRRVLSPMLRTSAPSAST